MAKALEAKTVVYVLENGEQRMEFPSLGEAREAVRSLDAETIASTVRILKETRIIEVMNSYQTATKQVVSLISS